MDSNNGNVEPPSANENMLQIPRISEAPAIMQALDRTAKQNLLTTAHTHRRITRNNTPGVVTAIQRVAPALILPEPEPTSAKHRSTRVRTTTSPVIIIQPYRMLVGKTRASARLISQQALNAMTMVEALTPQEAFMPQKNGRIAYEANLPNYAHFVLPMVHPTMGETISSMILKLPTFGRHHLDKILAEWHRGTMKWARKGLIQCL